VERIFTIRPRIQHARCPEIPRTAGPIQVKTQRSITRSKSYISSTLYLRRSTCLTPTGQTPCGRVTQKGRQPPQSLLARKRPSRQQAQCSKRTSLNSPRVLDFYRPSTVILQAFVPSLSDPLSPDPSFALNAREQLSCASQVPSISVPPKNIFTVLQFLPFQRSLPPGALFEQLAALHDAFAIS